MRGKPAQFWNQQVVMELAFLALVAVCAPIVAYWCIGQHWTYLHTTLGVAAETQLAWPGVYSYGIGTVVMCVIATATALVYSIYQRLSQRALWNPRYVGADRRRALCFDPHHYNRYHRRWIVDDWWDCDDLDTPSTICICPSWNRRTSWV